ncbi:MAG: hypothetical protein HUJ42_00320 [Malacoplasma sp.]|nr:hypothetical protein [Malacoplasma sp.]
MKNTLIFLVTEGIGLNKKWKGNYLKLAKKPNINYLISGIYPWAIISNDSKRNPIKLNRLMPTVKKDVDANFYEMLYGQTDIKTYLEMFEEQVNSKSLHNLAIFDKLVERSEYTNDKKVHIFTMLSQNTNKFNVKNLFFLVNILIKKGLLPVFHLIGDGQDEQPFNFNKTLIDFSKFLYKRNTPIVTISGRNYVFGKHGRSYIDNNHILNYFETICGLGENFFGSANEYANENLANKTMDADILPAANVSVDDCFVNEKSSIMFLNADPDDFAPLAKMFRSEPKLKSVFMSSLAPIYGVNVDELFFEDPVASKTDNLLANVIADHDNKVLVLGLNHKKGFIQKFFGKENSHPNVERKIISTPHWVTEKDYYKLSSKIMIDKTISNVGKYDVIFVMLPTIAEAAKTSDLNLLISTIEYFDLHLGRLVNLCRSTGNIIAFTSAYGACEKMLDKHLNLIPFNKSSPVPFVYTNGDLSAKHLYSNFLGIYSSVLSTLDSLDAEHRLFYTSLINPNFSKTKIENSLNDAFELWKNEITNDLIQEFEYNKLNFYSEFIKNEQFLAEKQKYVVLKELVNVTEKILLTPDARKKLYNVLLNYVEYNKVDFVGLDINYQKTFQTLFNDEIKLQKISKLSNRFFDKRLWNTNFLRNDKWINSVKFDLLENVSRSFDVNKKPKLLEKVLSNVLPFMFFEKIWYSEAEILKTNDAFAIAQFYELIKPEVSEVYEEYVAPKVVVADDFDNKNEDIIEENEIDAETVAINNWLYPIVSYYDYFEDVIDVVDSNNDKLQAFNNRFQETREYAINKLNNLDLSDIYNVPLSLLNPLTSKIVGIYRLYNSDLKNHYNSSFIAIKKIVYKFNMNYNIKINVAKEAIVYDGEFDEGINLENQVNLETKFLNYASLYREFDNTMISFEKEEDENEANEKELKKEVELDENGNPIIVDDINDVRIRMRKEYDMTAAWVQKRCDEYLNVDNIKEDIASDAEQIVSENNQFKKAKHDVKDYNRLSEAWKKNNQMIDFSQYSEPLGE